MESNTSRFFRVLPKSLPHFVIAAGFISLLWCENDWGGFLSRKLLQRIINYELLMIHAGAFLGWVLLWRPASKIKRIVRNCSFTALILIYSLCGYGDDGVRGIVMVWGLGLATYIGVFLNRLDDVVLASVLIRWFIYTMTMFFVVGFPYAMYISFTKGRPMDWERDLEIGIFFFLLTGLYEAFLFSRWEQNEPQPGDKIH